MPRRDPHPEAWSTRWFRDLCDRQREAYERRVLTARLHGVGLDSFAAFHDLHHLNLIGPLQNKPAGRKRRRKTRLIRRTGWIWNDT